MNKKKTEPFCESEEYCPCDWDKMRHCKECEYYQIIDSGYGHCIALPAVVIVPWCRITCSLFKLHKINIT